jgi:DNA modification methylase
VDPNLLYYGDNLDVLRLHVKDESVDLVYLDPPFNSHANYNVLFTEHGVQSAAQIHAFEDTWKWDEAAVHDYQRTVEQGGTVAEALRSFQTLIPESNMLAYLSMMAPRLLELRRVMKSTALIYLHCDPTASHYLKLLMDAVFSPKRFLNEVCWKRSSAHSDTKQGMQRYGRVHDILLVYAKGDTHGWTPLYMPYTAAYDSSEYRHVASDGRRYKETDLTAAKPGGDTSYQWHVKRPAGAGARWVADTTDEHLQPVAGWEYRAVAPYQGRFWAYSKKNLLAFSAAGELMHRATGMPRLMQFAEKMPGVALQDVWDDIQPASGLEDLGYATQKPQALLERIIGGSTKRGDTVLDPFCGCGTSIDAAQKLGRRWIGIDITHLAIGLIKRRLADSYTPAINQTYQVVGEPTDQAGAERLAADDPWQFQAWALDLVGARVATSAKKGRDRGIDGRLYFYDEGPGGKTKQIIFSVKAGGFGPDDLRALRAVADREGAQIGVLMTLHPASHAMRAEAASAGLYTAPWGGTYPRLQLLTVGQLLEGKQIEYPRLTGGNVTHRRAPRELKAADQGELGYGDTPPSG